jgi:hypothetical protein
MISKLREGKKRLRTSYFLNFETLEHKRPVENLSSDALKLVELEKDWGGGLIALCCVVVVWCFFGEMDSGEVVEW